MTSARKRARTGGGEEDEGPAPVADGFEAPIFGVRVVGKVSTLALEGEDGPLSLGTAGVASDHAGAWYVATKDSLLHVSPARRVRRVAALPSDEYYTVDASPDGSAAFVADYSGNKIRRVQVATGEVTTIAGSSEDGDADGVGDAAQFCGPAGIALSSDGSALFVADYENHMIRRVEVATGAVTTLAGGGDEDDTDGVDEAAEFDYPAGIAISPDSSALFVADCSNHKIRRVEVATGAVATLAGSGENGDADGVGDAAQFNNPYGIAISPDGGALFVADFHSHKIRRVEVATGAVTTIAGSGTRGSTDGVGDAAQFDCPEEVAFSPDGSTLLVSSYGGLRQVCVALDEDDSPPSSSQEESSQVEITGVRSREEKDAEGRANAIDVDGLSGGAGGSEAEARPAQRPRVERSVRERLVELKSLHDEGLISEANFEARQRVILDDM